MRALAGTVMAGLLVMVSQGVGATELEEIRAASLSGDRVQVNLRFSDGPPEDVRAFAVEAPPRLTLDLPDAGNALPSRETDINVGSVLGATTVEAGDRTRVVLRLTRASEYQTRVEGNNLILTLGRGVSEAGPSEAEVVERVGEPSERATRSARPVEITGIDFRRGSEGEGRVEIDLSRSGAEVNVREQAGRVELSFPRAMIDEELERRLDVMDFATPVEQIDTVAERDRVRMVVGAHGDYEVLSYQSDRQFVLEVAPISEAEQRARAEQEDVYEGERLSLNFQDIEVRSVLQLLADFTDLNIVVSDTVGGNITLRLNNVPWDQALDIILQARGLDKRMDGNVLYVAPSEEIAARERLQLEATRDREELEPVRTEFVQINFAQAEQIASLIRNDEGEFLSERGSVTVDSRTNTLLVQDTLSRIEDVRRLVQTLDVPVQQVLIETRIVIAEDSFNRELGARFGVTGGDRVGNTSIGTSGTTEAASGVTEGLAGGPGGAPGLPGRLNSSLPVVDDRAGRAALSILRPNVMLDLELSALQVEGRGEIISSPRVTTTNGQPALIEQGQDIPIVVQDEAGNPITEMVEAYLATEVTPQITPNGNVILDIKVTKDDPGEVIFDGVTINRRGVQTQVFVGDGETVVLGGVYEIDSRTNLEKVPFFGDIPFLGNFFRHRSNENAKAELLIFVTPRVLD